VVLLHIGVSSASRQTALTSGLGDGEGKGKESEEERGKVHDDAWFGWFTGEKAGNGYETVSFWVFVWFQIVVETVEGERV